MTPYPKYKDSGIEWISEIPSTWQLTKLKHVVSKIGSGVTPRGGSEAYQEAGIPLLRSQNIHFDGLRLEDVAFISEEIHDDMSNSKVRSGDVLLNITGASIGRCYYWPAGNQEANVNQHVCIIRPSEKADTRFIYNFLCSGIGQFQIDYCQNGANREGLSNEQLGGFFFPLPPLPEQRAIAAFLDDKTTKIDRLLQAKRRQIALLKEERTALINQAVTRGLDPDVPLKDSGVEWIGMIPRHWEVKELKYVGDCQNGISKPAEFFGTGYPFVSYGDVYRNLTLPKTVVGLVQSTEADRSSFSVLEGDVLFTRTSETVEEIGFASTCLETIEDATFAGFVIRFRPWPNLIQKEFSKYYFRSEIHRKYFVKEMNLVTRASLSQELLRKLPVLLPPMWEQIEIARELDRLLAIQDSLVSKIEKEIELLQEYRTALISEVVTGKLRVG